MKEPKWLTTRMVLALHEEAVGQFGGMPGVRDEALLESALSKPRHRFAYAKPTSLFDLAAALCEGLVHHHPFADGNKRTGLLAARAFLYLNGWVFEPEEREEVDTLVALATRQIGAEEMAAWFRRGSRRRAKR